MNEAAAKEISQWERDAHPSYSGIAEAFRTEMLKKEYGYDETMDAWQWFKAGYLARLEK